MTKRKRPAVVARGGKENPVKQVQPLKRSTRKRCAEQTGAAASQADATLIPSSTLKSKNSSGVASAAVGGGAGGRAGRILPGSSRPRPGLDDLLHRGGGVL